MKKTAQERNQTAGLRLAYILKLRNLRAVDLIKYVELNTDLNVNAPMMSQYLKGKKSMPVNMVIAFADFLEIDAGYLLGLDGYLDSNNDYLVYCSANKVFSDFKQNNSELDKPRKYLSILDYKITGFSRTKGKLSEIKIEDNTGKSFLIPHNEVKLYTKDVEKYLKSRTMDLLKSNTTKGSDAK